MTPELQKYYETYFDLFTTDGWKQFIEDVKESADAFNVRHVENETALKFVQGQLTVMDKIVNWDNMVKAAFEQVNEQDEE